MCLCVSLTARACASVTVPPRALSLSLSLVVRACGMRFECLAWPCRSIPFCSLKTPVLSCLSYLFPSPAPPCLLLASRRVWKAILSLITCRGSWARLAPCSLTLPFFANSSVMVPRTVTRTHPQSKVCASVCVCVIVCVCVCVCVCACVYV